MVEEREWGQVLKEARKEVQEVRWWGADRVPELPQGGVEVPVGQ